MIVTRAPYRISLFGGATDFPEYYKLYGAIIIGFSINLHVYVCLSKTLELFPYKSRVTYSKIEDIAQWSEIQNNGVRGPLGYFDIQDGLNVSVQTSLPAQTGIASSSALILALLKALDIYKNTNETLSKEELAKIAVLIERNLLLEVGGVQDEILISFGKQNFINLSKDGFKVDQWNSSYSFLSELRERLVLCYAGGNRESYRLAEANKDADLNLKHTMKEIASAGREAIINEDVNEIGRLIDLSWQQKRQITGVSNEKIDTIYTNAKKNGAIGGKILGSGGNGFMLFVLEDGMNKNEFSKNLGLFNIDWNYDYNGVQLMYNG